MQCRKVFSSKVLLGSFNVVFLISGLMLLVLGFLLLCDSPRILLSRLLTSSNNESHQPPFYYGALALMGAGIFMVASGAVGCWATYTKGYCILTFYFIMVLIAMVSQGAACVIVVGWPGCVGLQGARGGAVGALQSSYGVPGQEQFTAAMDLAQTNFNCCGMTDGKNYDMSRWQLLRLGPRDLVVPLTCCVQDDRKSYLDPKPLNETICQQLLPEQFSIYRHTQGCLTKVEIWYQQQYIGFLVIILVLALIEFGVLFSTIYSCMRLKKQRSESGSFIVKPINNKNNENIYHNNKIGTKDRKSSDGYLYPDSFYSPRSKNPHSYDTRDEMA